MLRDIELNGERNRGIYVIKSRGMAHSNQIREYTLSKRGIEIIEPYLGADGVLTGSARLAQEAKEQAVILERQQSIERKERLIAQKRTELDAQIEALRSRFENEIAELSQDMAEANSRVSQVLNDREAMQRSRLRLKGAR